MRTLKYAKRCLSKYMSYVFVISMLSMPMFFAIFTAASAMDVGNNLDDTITDTQLEAAAQNY